MNFNAELALNGLSFGNVSINILHEWYKQGLEPCIFPIGQIQLNAHNWITEDFKNWLQSCLNKSLTTYSRKNPTIKLWHINGAQNQVSERQVLLTFHETDMLTETEVNICKNNSKVLVTSEYAKQVFEKSGLDNVSKVPLGFDSNSFKRTTRKYFPDGVIAMTLAGKLEHRKRSLDVLNLWAKRYGNDKRYFLNCALFNQFIPPEQQQKMIAQALEGKRYFNINFNPYMDRNDAYNDYLNASHIVLGMSACEGWGLPEFQSMCLGKHAVILDAHAYKEYANDSNAILVPTNGMSDAYDGMFFQKGGPFNQGQMFTWAAQDFYAGVDKAIERVRKNPINEAGLKLVEEFPYSQTANTILSNLWEIY